MMTSRADDDIILKFSLSDEYVIMQRNHFNADDDIIPKFFILADDHVTTMADVYVILKFYNWLPTTLSSIMLQKKVPTYPLNISTTFNENTSKLFTVYSCTQ